MRLGSEPERVTVGVTSGVLVGQNPHRETLLISVPPGRAVTITQRGIAVLDGPGVTLRNLVEPFLL
jgi:hypothetical protein